MDLKVKKLFKNYKKSTGSRKKKNVESPDII